MVCLNSKVPSNMMTLDANLILIKILSSQNHIPFSMQAFSHSCLPLKKKKFVHVIIFYKVAYANVKHHILKKHLLHLIILFVKVCGPKICGDCRTKRPTFFFPCCCEWFTSTIIIFSTTCTFFLTNNLGCAKSTWVFMGMFPLILVYLINLFFKKNFGLEYYLPLSLIYK
jgi:hypothetical protein